MSALEDKLAFQIKALGLPDPVQEHRFHPTRRWRFDFAWPDIMIACEVEGGAYVNGRHSRGKGFDEDCRKYGEAMKLGWTVYRCSGTLVKTGEAAAVIEALLKRD